MLSTCAYLRCCAFARFLPSVVLDRVYGIIHTFNPAIDTILAAYPLPAYCSTKCKLNNSDTHLLFNSTIVIITSAVSRSRVHACELLGVAIHHYASSYAHIIARPAAQPHFSLILAFPPGYGVASFRCDKSINPYNFSTENDSD